MNQIIAAPTRRRSRPSRASLLLRSLGGPAVAGVAVGALATVLAPTPRDAHAR